MTNLRAVDDFPPPPERFDIEAMQSNAKAAERWAQYASGVLTAVDAMEELLPEVVSTLGSVDIVASRARAEQELLELNNHYRGLHGNTIELVAHSEVFAEEIRNQPREVLIRRYEPIRGRFFGFAYIDSFGVCVLLGEEEPRKFPLRDVEDIWT